MNRARDPLVTSRIMSRVRNKDSKAELMLRRELHRRGLRYRLHCRDVLGTPDICIKRYRLAVFVDGDMWHGNEHKRRGLDNLAELFPNNTEFWVAKITGNIQRDHEVSDGLAQAGWTVLRLWESLVLENPNEAADMVEAARAL